jgi:outer membrane protein TolC
MAMAALVLVSFLCGAAGVVAKGQIQESRQKELLIARTEMELSITELQLRIIRSEMEEMQNRFQAGLVGEEALSLARMRLQEIESQMVCLQIDIEEINASGEEPRNDPAAPLIGDRDFFSERLTHQLAVVAMALQQAEKKLERSRHLLEAGAINETEFQEIEAAFREPQFEYMDLAAMLEIRERFLKGEIDEEQVIREVKLIKLRNRLELLKSLIKITRSRCERIQELFDGGLISEVELLRSRVKLLEEEQELQFLIRQIEFLSPPVF